MEKIIERNVPIAEENVTLSGQPATNMFEDWSENITETDLSHPAWVCGLKLVNCGHRYLPDQVTPCVGVWIETNCSPGIIFINSVTPCVGVWIETTKIS